MILSLRCIRKPWTILCTRTNFTLKICSMLAGCEWQNGSTAYGFNTASTMEKSRERQGIKTWMQIKKESLFTIGAYITIHSSSFFCVNMSGIHECDGRCGTFWQLACYVIHAKIFLHILDWFEHSHSNVRFVLVKLGGCVKILREWRLLCTLEQGSKIVVE